MQLFSGITELFIEKATNNEIAPTLEENFRRSYGYGPSPAEVRSWVVSLKDLAFSLAAARVTEAGIIVEYRLPMSSKRLDAMLVGPGHDGQQRSIIVELKQWDRAYKCGIEDCVSFSQKPGGEIHIHPSRQAGSYAEYLQGSHTAFYSESGQGHVHLKACSFLHNANSRSCGDLLDEEFAETLHAYPLYTGDLREDLEEWLWREVGQGDGYPGLQHVLQSRYMPSRKLLDHVAAMVEGNPAFSLLDEQLVAYNIVTSKVKELERRTGKAVVVVIGGPGTGKSVIAVRLLAELAKAGRNAVHATGSKAFTTNLRAKVGRHAAGFFKYFNSFTDQRPNSIDVLIADEAHRIRQTSKSRFNPRVEQDQIFELMDAAKVIVFLLDDHQVVRPGEVGTPALIREAARGYGAELFEIALRGQFRCSGSESYLDWLDHAFDLGGAQDIGWQQDYEFGIADSPAELEELVRSRAAAGSTARLVAGFCWPWSDPSSDGTLVDDVKIGGWERPWNRRAKGSPPPQRHPYTIWATQPAGIDEIGCIYSAQGFEFDYCGVIVGRDLIRRGDHWEGAKEESYDVDVRRSGDLASNLRNTYRVLMSRGMKGTFVYFLDAETREYFEKLLVVET